MKADKQEKIDRRNEKRGVYKKYSDIVDEQHKDVPTIEEKVIEKVEEKVEEKVDVSSKDERIVPEDNKKVEEKVEEKVVKPKRKYTKKNKSV